ncbi:MAG: hypothetical protein RJA63_724 [Pseudomonadota bacterium]|jgi:hypothetical protein|nr:hypothetical protein [Uliginosibacterium sp.]MBK9395252.1 hypothetical protein [Uliginosibacterium sp.]
MPFIKSFLKQAPACLVLGTCALAHAADCNIEALNNAQRYNYRYTPTYFEVGKNYELGTPFTLKPGGQLVYRKIGRKDLFLVPETNIVYDPGWFLSITFRLMAGQKYPAEANRDKRVPLYVIRQSGGQGNSQLLYVNQQGFLCERVGSYSEPSGDFRPIPTLVKGNYTSTPTEAHLLLQEEVDPKFSSATAITLEEEGASMLKLTLNQFSAGELKRTVSKQFDRNAADDLQFEGWHFALHKQNDGSYRATVVAQPE